jgi:hypothetical protein
MTQITNDMTEVEISVEEWLAIRKEAGLTIDPRAAEVMWTYANTIDPYDVHTDLSDEEKQIGRVYFARAPGNYVWVHYGHLPDATFGALRGSKQEHRSLAAFEVEFSEMAWMFEEG